MATKTISIEIDAYDLLVRKKRDPKESFSRVIRRVLSERPTLTAGDLLTVMLLLATSFLEFDAELINRKLGPA